MRRISVIFTTLLISLYVFPMVNCKNNLLARLDSCVKGIDARIGISIITPDSDTIAINGNKDFPMMSVFKFPVAIATAEWMDRNGYSMNRIIKVPASSLSADTYSPMIDKYGLNDITITYRELLEWSLIESDNNAVDILIEIMGGTDSVMSILKESGIPDGIIIEVTENDMHKDNYLSYLNRSTPIAMSDLFKMFDTELKYRSLNFRNIATMLERCQTGLDRLPAPFQNTKTIIGHKTGTGFMSDEGRLTAINDCGYIHLPNGSRYYISVFIADSGYDMKTTSSIIAKVSEIVKDYFVGN